LAKKSRFLGGKGRGVIKREGNLWGNSKAKGVSPIEKKGKTRISIPAHGVAAVPAEEERTLN